MEERSKVELSNDEYKSLVVSDKMLYHIIKIVESELEWDWDEPRLSSRGLSIIKYLALEVSDINKKIEELRKAEKAKNE